jgi:hypothetical protein
LFYKIQNLKSTNRFYWILFSCRFPKGFKLCKKKKMLVCVQLIQRRIEIKSWTQIAQSVAFLMIQNQKPEVLDHKNWNLNKIKIFIFFWCISTSVLESHRISFFQPSELRMRAKIVSQRYTSKSWPNDFNRFFKRLIYIH